MAVQAVARAVVAAGCPGVGVAGEVLHVPEGHAGVESSGDGAVAQAVRAEPVCGGKACSTSKLAHQPPGGGLRHPSATPVQEERPARALTDVGLQRPGCGRRQRLGAALTALAGEHEHPVAEVVAEVLDVPGQGLADAQAVEGQQCQIRRAAERRPSASAASSSLTSSFSSRPTVEEWSETLGRLTRTTGEASIKPASTTAYS